MTEGVRHAGGRRLLPPLRMPLEYTSNLRALGSVVKTKSGASPGNLARAPSWPREAVETVG